MAHTTLEQLLKLALDFRDARDWKQFHTLTHLAANLSIEAAEVQEVMLWLSDQEVNAGVAGGSLRDRLTEEIGDVFLTLLLLCDAGGIDLENALRSKLQVNALKYPVSKALARSTKYTNLE